MKAKEILKAIAYNDPKGAKGIVQMPSEITCIEDVIESLERQLGDEIDVDESLMDNFLPDTEYFYTEEPLTNEEYVNKCIGIIPTCNIVYTYNDCVYNFYKIDE